MTTVVGCVLGVLVIVAIVCIAANVGFQSTHRCVRGHTERVPEFIEMLTVGDVLVPIVTPAHDVFVCDEWEPK